MRKISVAVWTIMISFAGAGVAQVPQPSNPPQPAQASQPAPPVYFEPYLQQELSLAQENIKRATEELKKNEWKLQHNFELLHKDLNLPALEWKAREAMEIAKLNTKLGFLAQKPPKGVGIGVGPGMGRRDEGAYRRGTHHLDRREWEKAVEAFDNVIRSNGNRADGALYWKAYALNKLGRRPDALNTLAQLQKDHAKSSWLNDAKALEAEIKQARGQAISPESETDEELKIYAINSLMNTDPERALPLLEKLLKSQNSPQIKERALFVLAQSRSPKAQQIIAGIARGGANPDLQLKAVEFLAIHSGGEGRRILPEIYSSTNDFAVKQAVLRAYMMGKESDKLLASAKSEPNPELRREAIHWLGVTGAQAEIWQLYQSETSPELKEALIHAMFVGGSVDRLIELAKTEKNADLRASAIHRLGTLKGAVTGDALAQIYASESDTSIKKRLIHAMFIQGNAKQLIELARKESNAELKKEMVHRLSVMKSPEATEFLVELLNK
jgi:HEAT repeat protein